MITIEMLKSYATDLCSGFDTNDINNDYVRGQAELIAGLMEAAGEVIGNDIAESSEAVAAQIVGGPPFDGYAILTDTGNGVNVMFLPGGSRDDEMQVWIDFGIAVYNASLTKHAVRLLQVQSRKMSMWELADKVQNMEDDKDGFFDGTNNGSTGKFWAVVVLVDIPSGE